MADPFRAIAYGGRLAFVGGLHRSGTSIVHRCLADHPEVSGLHDTGVPEDEGQHLQSLYPPAWVHGGPGVFGFSPEAHLDETSPLVSEANARKLLSEWLPYWDADRRILVEKSPQNLLQSRFLQALFPSCRFIIVLRHPVAVSYATQKWTTWAPRLRRLGISNKRLPKIWIHRLIEHWLVCHERFERDRPHLNEVLVVRYEDFVANPQERLHEMQAFLGLPPAELQREVQGGVNDRYWRAWEARRSHPLTRFYAQAVVRRLEERVRRFGYSLLSERVAQRSGGAGA